MNPDAEDCETVDVATIHGVEDFICGGAERDRGATRAPSAGGREGREKLLEDPNRERDARGATDREGGRGCKYF